MTTNKDYNSSNRDRDRERLPVINNLIDDWLKKAENISVYLGSFDPQSMDRMVLCRLVELLILAKNKPEEFVKSTDGVIHNKDKEKDNIYQP